MCRCSRKKTGAEKELRKLAKKLREIERLEVVAATTRELNAAEKSKVAHKSALDAKTAALAGIVGSGSGEVVYNPHVTEEPLPPEIWLHILTFLKVGELVFRRNVSRCASNLSASCV